MTETSAPPDGVQAISAYIKYELCCPSCMFSWFEEHDYLHEIVVCEECGEDLWVGDVK